MKAEVGQLEAEANRLRTLLHDADAALKVAEQERRTAWDRWRAARERMEAFRQAIKALLI